MSASNWVLTPPNNGEISPDRNNRYRVDNRGLQRGLDGNLPIELIGASHRPNFHGVLSMPMKRSRKINKEKEIKWTVDGIPIRKVYVTNIGIEVDRREIVVIFSEFGKIMSIFLSVSKIHPNKKFAFVTFADPKAAKRAVTRGRLKDARGHCIYVMAADSWHQPKENANGEIIWNGKMQDKEEESEEEDVCAPTVESLEAVQISKDSLNILNDDCMLHIFSFLSLHEIARVEIVCKRWQALSYRMWRYLHKLSFSEPPFNESRIDTPTLEAYLQRCGPSLRELDLSNMGHYFKERTLAIIAKHCDNLEVLRLSYLDVGNRGLAHLGRRCPKLKELILDACTKFNDKDLISLLTKCNELSVLTITCNPSITGKFLAKLQSPLVSLHLNKVPSFQASALIEGLQKASASLQSLWIESCKNLHTCDMKRIVAAVPNLTSLGLCNVGDGLKFDSNSMVSIGKLNKLKSINLNLNYAVNDKMLAAIVEGCEDLVDLCLSGRGGYNGPLTEQGLSMLSRIRRLTYLDISYLECTTNDVLRRITARNSKLQKLTCRGCPELTDEGCMQVLTVCNDLELFDLSGCRQITEQTISAALTSIRLRTNNVPLRLIVGGSGVCSSVDDPDTPLLTVDLDDLSIDYYRPDYAGGMYFLPSDSEDEDIDHLCCDCDFDFDDLYDPTLCSGIFGGGSPLEYEDYDEEWGW